MNIYFISSPRHINHEAWDALLHALKIDMIVDLLRYKPTVANPFNCYNDVFDRISYKRNFSEMLGKYFEKLSAEARSEVYFHTLRCIFNELANIGIELYYDCETEWEQKENKEKQSVLVLYDSKSQDNAIRYCGKYFFRTIYNKTPHTSCRRFIDFIILDFEYRESYRYSTQKNGFEKMFCYSYEDDAKICRIMNEIYCSLDAYGVTDKNLFQPRIAPSIIKCRLKADEKWCKEKREQEDGYEIGNWGDDELRGMDESFPGWRWNID